jgi:hypothetical protein
VFDVLRRLRWLSSRVSSPCLPVWPMPLFPSPRTMLPPLSPRSSASSAEGLAQGSA